MEMSAKRKAHCVGHVGEEWHHVFNCVSFWERGWMYRLFWFVQCDDVLQLYVVHGVGEGVFRSCLLMMCVCFSWSWHVKANEPIRGSFRVFMSGSECAKVLV